MGNSSRFAFQMETTTDAAEKEVTLCSQGFDSLQLAPEPVPYARLTHGDVYAMAMRHANLSKAYANGKLNASSECQFYISGQKIPKDGRTLIEQTMTRLSFTLMSAPSFSTVSQVDPENLGAFRETFRARLEDPGFLAHVLYYGSDSDPDFLCFYWNLWFRNGVNSSSFFRGKVWEPMGGFHNADPDSSWGRFAIVEGQALTERNLTAIWTERLINMSDKTDQMDIAQTNRSVCLLGLSLTHPLESLESILLSGARQLDDGGIACFDLPVKNQSLRRLIRTVGFPTYPGFKACSSTPKALQVARGIVSRLNSALKREALEAGSSTFPYMDVVDQHVLSYGAWGDTSVYVCLKKYTISNVV